MTGEIIPFPPPSKKTGKEQQAKITKKITNLAIFADVTEDILGEWQRHAVHNNLSDYIASKIPSRLRLSNMTDYVSDLNALSQIEQKLGMKISVFYPGTGSKNTVGWQAVFHRDREVFGTPPDMASEAIARALNLVLYISFIETLSTLGR